MKFAVAVAGFALVAGAGAAAQDLDAHLEDAPITLRGCVVPGQEPDTFVLNRVLEVGRDGKVILPVPLQTPTIYWLDDASGLRPHAGRMVEISGEIEGIERSEIELKAGNHPNGGLVAELELPERDVEARADQIPGVVGTSGTAGGADVKTVVLKIDVEDVKPAAGVCQ